MIRCSRSAPSGKVGVVWALIALLYNVLNQTFGLTAVQNEVDPDALVLTLDEEKMLAAPNTITSEDDNDLVAGIAAACIACPEGNAGNGGSGQKDSQC